MAGLNLPEYLKGKDFTGEGTVLRSTTDSVEDAEEIDDNSTSNDEEDTKD